MTQDLHDGIGGIITNIGLMAERSAGKAEPHTYERSLRTIGELAIEGLEEMRTFMRSQSPAVESWPALAAELRRLGSSRLEPLGIEFSFHSSVAADSPPPPRRLVLNLLRVQREALT